MRFSSVLVFARFDICETCETNNKNTISTHHGAERTNFFLLKFQVIRLLRSKVEAAMFTCTTVYEVRDDFYGDKHFVWEPQTDLELFLLSFNG